MDSALRFLDIVAWPVTTLALAWFFRNEVRAVLSRITSLKYKDFEAKFGKGLSSVEEKISAQPEKLEVPVEEFSRLERLAEVSPRAAILEAWIELEQVLFAMGESHEIKAWNPIQIVRALSNAGVLSKELALAFDELRRLRNEAAHVPDFVIEEKEAQRFIKLSESMSLLLRNIDDFDRKNS